MTSEEGACDLSYQCSPGAGEGLTPGGDMSVGLTLSGGMGGAGDLPFVKTLARDEKGWVKSGGGVTSINIFRVYIQVPRI